MGSPPVEPLPSSMIGSTIQHYQVRERLGAGGMGEVYLAQDVRLGRAVALKFLLAEVQNDPERRARLMTEARAASALHSSNIAAIYDIGEHDGAIFIVMEYVEGELLSSKLARGFLPTRESITTAMQIADALDEAHTRGIVHRDIKSGNVIVTPRGQVKILDFGLARFVRGDGGAMALPDDRTTEPPQHTLPGTLMGTMAYMSPEQALSKPADHRSDLFSLGVVLFEMLTARLPFAADNLPAMIDRLLHHPPPPVSRFNREPPPELEAIVRKTLEKNPDHRYQSASDLREDLKRVRAALDSAALRDTPGRTSMGVAVAGVAVEAPNAIAVMTFSNISKEASDDWVGSGIAETVTADLKNIQGLTVIGRERIFDALRNLGSSDSTPDERFAIDIGRGLGARWIVAGGYQRFGEMIRITARLVDIQTGGLLKTVKIDGRTSDIFDLQDKIVYELSSSLNLHLDRTEMAAIEQSETQSVEAYESYSKGMLSLRLASRDSLDRAIYFFEKAVEHDSSYAMAWTALGESYSLKASLLSLPDLFPKAIEMLQRAIELNPRLASAYAYLGSAYLGSGRYDDAVGAIRQAIRIEPNNPSARSSLARAFWMGKGMFEEAIQELEQVVQINPKAGYSWLQLALLYTLVGDYTRAEAACRKAIDLQEQFLSGTEGLMVVGAHTRLGYVFYRRGQYEDAIREYQRELMFLSAGDHVLRDRTTIELNQKLGAAYLRMGDREQANRHFKTAVKGFEERVAKGADDPATKYYIACLWALREDGDRALRYLQETIQALPALNRRRASTDPDFDPIRQDPRFEPLVSAS